MSIAVNLKFNKITSINGISQSEVNCFLEDSNGFMWFGTLDGLNRFDGYTITKYNVDKKTSNSLSNNTIRALIEDKFGRIWIGTDDGLNVMLPKNQKFYRLKIPKLKSSFISIFCMLIVGDNLRIGTDKGLYKANINNENIEDIEKSIVEELVSIREKDSNTKINSMAKTKEGYLWIGGLGKTMCFKTDKTHNLLGQINVPELISKNAAKRIVIDHAGQVWLGFYEGVMRYNSKNKKLTIFTNTTSANSISSNMINDLTVDKDGSVWASTLDKGLNKINANEVQKENVNFERFQNNIYDHNSLNSNLTLCIYATKDNIIWVGTIGNGVNYAEIHQKKFTLYNIPPLDNETSLSTNFIRSIYLDNNNKMWIGTHNNGLFIYNRNSYQYAKIKGFESQSIFHILPIASNTLVLSAYKGLYILNENLNIQKIDEIKGPCFFATLSKSNVYWIAKASGLSRMELSNNKAVRIDNYDSNSSKLKLSFKNCRTITYDDIKNEIWVGTEGGGLNILSLDKNHFPYKNTIYRTKDNKNSISNNYIRSIYKQNNNTFWIGTYEGLNKVVRNNINNKLVFTTLTQKEGLPNNLIQSITEDNDHNLWIGSNGGLTKLNPNNLELNNYDISDGLQSNEFSEHTCYRSKNGELFFGGINGINSFFPNAIKKTNVLPQISITDFYLFNEKIEPETEIKGITILEKPIFLTEKLSLKPSQNNIRFGFSAMIFTSPQKVKYAYKLDGYDKEWIITDAQRRSATYMNLPYGNYSFMVKATNGDGEWNENIKQIDIHISTPFYLTWFAFLIYIILIATAFYYLTRYSIIKITTKKQIEIDIEHNNFLLELDKIRTRFFINISHDLRTPLTLILGPLEQIIKGKNIPEEFKNQINVVHKNAFKLKYLIEQLLDFRKHEVGKLNVSFSKVDFNKFILEEINYFDLMLKEKKLEISYAYHLEKEEIYIDRDKTSKIIFNLLSNAIKFTNAGKISITIENATLSDTSRYFAKISIIDTGIGIEIDKIEHVFDRFYNESSAENDSSYGIGLSHCKDLIEAMNGHIKVESEKGVGSTFNVYLPIIENMEEEEKSDASTILNSSAIVYEESTVNEEQIKKTQSKYTILIADDNDDLRDYIKSCLIDDYNIIETENGAIGYNLALRNLPDLIISDIVMPVMDGITFCEKIKSNLETSHIPVILLTARTDNDIKFKGLEIGADDYISKPFDIDYLNVKVKSLIASRENLRNLFQKNIKIEPSKVTVTSLDEKFINTLLVEIEKGIPNPDFTIDFLEKEMGMSHSKFYRKVKNLTGQSGKELLQEMRLKRAVQLITDNKKISVADLADMVGFSDPKHFSACFRQKYGVSPSDY